CARELPFAYW
nr:immunoglobulin heavy chain junction region [Mus musculus]